LSQWVGESVRFLNQLWGDFPVGEARFVPLTQRPLNTIDAPLKKMLDEPGIVSVLEQYGELLSWITTNPMNQGQSLRQLSAWEGSPITPEILAKLDADLAELD
jgi:hypothetical protein